MTSDPVIDTDGKVSPGTNRPGDFGLSLSWPTAAAFAGLYAVLLAIGYALKPTAVAPTTVWPASGLLLCTLVLLRKRDWPWILLISAPSEIFLNAAFTSDFTFGSASWFALANATDALVGAALVQYGTTELAQPRLLQVIRFYGASAIGCACGATLAVVGFTRMHPEVDALTEWQRWWGGNWLGVLTFGPLALTWVLRWQYPDRARDAPSWPRILGLLGLLALVSIWIFGSSLTSQNVAARLPFAIFPVLIALAAQGSPRWAMTGSTLLVVIAATLTNHGLGPFAFEATSTASALALQVFLALTAITAFMIATAVLENRWLLAGLRLSNQRYTSFVTRATEAVWRVELRRPMPMSLPPSERLDWLQTHAYIAECSSHYRRLVEHYDPNHEDISAWRADVPWSEPLLRMLRDVAHPDYRIDGARVTIQLGDEAQHWLVAFDGVVEGDQLHRFWGAARDVTELVRVTERLQLERARLRAYAWELGQAEERAQRATAIDLHDGIGQLLVGLRFNLNALEGLCGGDMQALITESQQVLSQIQSITREVIADLSPPGLYDLGLTAALKWLSGRVADANGLEMTLNIAVPDDALDAEWRVFTFKIVRELVQNVVKHARTDVVEVSVTLDSADLTICVADQGVGFALPPEGLPAGGHRFGLWSIADRVRAVGGRFHIHAAPGSGCRVTISVHTERGSIQAHFGEADEAESLVHGRRLRAASIQSDDDHREQRSVPGPN